MVKEVRPIRGLVQSTNRNPMRNIRIADNVWFKAKEAAVHNRITLQNWLTEAITQKLQADGVEVEQDRRTSPKD